MQRPWTTTREPQSTPRYDPDVIETNQKRAAKVHRRSLERFQNQPCRHFYLPQRRVDTQSSVEEVDQPDSEDDTPVRARLVPFMALEDGEDGDADELVHSHEITLHRDIEQAHPELAPHSCHLCRKVTIDLRRQLATEIYHVEEWKQQPKGWRTYPTGLGVTFDEACAAASEGCSFFDFVVREIRHESRDPAKPCQGSAQITVAAWMRGWSGLWFSIQGRFGMRMTSLWLYTIPGAKQLHKMLGKHLPPNLAPSSELSFVRARTWLAVCDEKHEGCQLPQSDYMPKRVIEIFSQSTPSSAKLSCRLSTVKQASSYVALSYCWGGDQDAKTTKANLADYEQAIDPEALPQTLQDAIKVTYGIGLRYLWVDAMCIIQDDEADKDDQISQMYQVYRNAYVTISASTTEKSTQGFLKPRSQYSGFVLSARFDDNVFGEVLAVRERLSAPVGKVSPEDMYPIFKRGWTYQEHKLSRRLLVYGHLGLMYWCQGCTYRDGGHEPGHGRVQGIYATSLLRRANLPSPDEPVAISQHPAAWGEVIEAYSNRDLTVEQDRLPAVSAVAEGYARTQPVTKYLAGIWREDFLSQCLWDVWDAGKTRRPAGYLAPSWSWASVIGDVRAMQWSPREDGESMTPEFTASLLEARSVPKSKAIPYGAVSSGFVKLRARARKVIWLNGGQHQGAENTGGRDAEATADDLDFLAMLGGSDPRIELNIDVSEEWWGQTEVQLWAVEICRYPFQTVSGVSGEGLLLVKEESSPERFRRAGRLSVRHQDLMREGHWFNERECQWRDMKIV